MDAGDQELRRLARSSWRGTTESVLKTTMDCHSKLVLQPLRNDQQIKGDETMETLEYGSTSQMNAIEARMVFFFTDTVRKDTF